jgi:hypothetical protein
MQRYSLTIVPCACAADGNGHVKAIAEPEHGADFFSRQRLNGHVGAFAIELRAKNRRVPVEVSGEAFNHGGLRDDSRMIAEHISQLSCKRLQSGCLLSERWCCELAALS